MDLINPKILLYIFSTFLLFSCQDIKEKRKRLVEEKISQITKNQEEWNFISNQILQSASEKSNLNKTLSPNDFDQSLSTILIKKGIRRITVQKNTNCEEIEYETSWSNYPIGTFYLVRTTCGNRKQTEKGFTQFGKNFIDVYGIGNNWLIWIDSDFI